MIDIKNNWVTKERTHDVYRIAFTFNTSCCVHHSSEKDDESDKILCECSRVEYSTNWVANEWEKLSFYLQSDKNWMFLAFDAQFFSDSSKDVHNCVHIGEPLKSSMCSNLLHKQIHVKMISFP